MLSESSSPGQRHPGQAVETGVYERRWTTKYRTDATIACSAESLRCLYYKREFRVQVSREGQQERSCSRDEIDATSNRHSLKVTVCLTSN
jgi:hypothetical protein